MNQKHANQIAAALKAALDSGDGITALWNLLLESISPYQREVLDMIAAAKDGMLPHDLAEIKATSLSTASTILIDLFKLGLLERVRIPLRAVGRPGQQHVYRYFLKPLIASMAQSTAYERIILLDGNKRIWRVTAVLDCTDKAVKHEQTLKLFQKAGYRIAEVKDWKVSRARS